MSTSRMSGEIDPKALRRSLGTFATGVAVVTARYEGQDFGVTVNSFTSVSLEPPLVLWCLARSSRTFDAFCAAEHFVINILALDQVAVANRFAFRTDEAFPADVPFERVIADSPRLEGSSAYFACRRADVLDGGDHVILMGEILDFDSADRPGLVYREGAYAVAEAHPHVIAQSGGAMEQGFLEATLRPALDAITTRFELHFDQELSDAGITSREAQILGLLSSRSMLNAEEISNESMVSGSFLEETMLSLVEKDLVYEEWECYALTDRGRTVAADWLEKLRSYRTEALGAVTPKEARALQNTLARLSGWVDDASKASTAE